LAGIAIKWRYAKCGNQEKFEYSPVIPTKYAHYRLLTSDYSGDIIGIKEKNKGDNMKRVIVFVSILLVVTSLIAGCGGGNAKTSLSTTSNTPKSSVTSTSTAPTSMAATTGVIQWPSAALVGVPVFSYGTIAGYKNNANGSVQVTIANISGTSAPGNYTSDLTKAGWSIYLSVYNTAAQGTEIEASLGQNGTISGLEIQFTSSGTKATITYNASSPPWQWTATTPAP
jgi:hypothetical protein